MKKLFLLFLTACLLQCSLFAPKAKAQVNIQDSLALMKIYYATGGPNWINTWDTLQPVSSWSGVTVDSGRVTKLVLSYKNLVSSIPPEIGNLSELEFLYFNNNQLSGLLPSELFTLSNLKGLDLSHNFLTGFISDSLGYLINLNFLNLQNNQFYGAVPASISNLENLQSISLDNNFITDLPSSICQFGLWFSLTIGNNLLDSLPSCMLEMNYSGLHISHNNLTKVPIHVNGLYYLNNNKVTFEYLEPIAEIGVPISHYSPQDSILLPIDTTIYLGDTVVFDSWAGGLNSIYQWKKNGIPIPLATDPFLGLNNVSFSDSGVYSCDITNDSVPGIVLNRSRIVLHVTNQVSTSEIQIADKPIMIYDANSQKLLVKNLPANSLVQVFNSLGSMVAQTSASEECKISLIPKRAYYVRIISNNSLHTHKIVTF